jgi:hypothetical protein
MQRAGGRSLNENEEGATQLSSRQRPRVRWRVEERDAASAPAFLVA